MNKKGIVIFLGILLAFCLSLSFPIKARAEEMPTIESMNNFYHRLSEQIYNRETVKNYIVNDYSLIKKIVDIDWTEYSKHYREDAPLTSGCYTTYYINKLYYSYRGNALRISIEFRYSKIDMRNHFARMEKLAQELKGKNDYETVKNVHDYLIDRYDYDTNTSNVNHTDIEGFRDGVMVCSGYGLASYYLLNSAGVKTRVITGYGGSAAGGGENHLWNIVCVDGKWYNMDVTWDDCGGQRKIYKYFLKSDDDFPDHQRMGFYDSVNFDSMVSEKSYPLPLSITFPSLILEHGRTLILAVVIIVTVVSAAIRKAKNRRCDFVADDVL
jgi:transglutaminase-like putative cysteine protease